MNVAIFHPGPVTRCIWRALWPHCSVSVRVSDRAVSEPSRAGRRHGHEVESVTPPPPPLGRRGTIESSDCDCESAPRDGDGSDQPLRNASTTLGAIS